MWLTSLALVATAATPTRLGWRAPDDVPLDRLLEDAPAHVACALRTADTLARTAVAYRAHGLFGRRDLDQEPFALSCSELVYYVYARCGVDLGDQHRRTRFLAYQEPPPYEGVMVRLSDLSELRIGDLLVYHRERSVVEREVSLRGSARPGHVVLLVSLAEKLVLGSHGRESTPAPGIPGVGYRIMPNGFGAWDERTLRAVYRPVETSSAAVLPPLPRIDSSTAAEEQ